MKRSTIRTLLSLGVMVTFLLPFAAAYIDEAEMVVEEEETAPGSGLDKLKKEWEAVREQQIQMIREKEDQLEKLKEEIFAKMKSLNVPAVPEAVVPESILPAEDSEGVVSDGRLELEAQKTALQNERQKFFKEMNRQKESLQKLRASLDAQAKQLEAERERFESEKKSAAR